MRFEKASSVLSLARELGSNAEGLTLDEMATYAGVSRRTAERMRDAVETVFGPLEWLDDGKKRRFRLAAQGLGNFAIAPTAEEIAELENAIRSLEAKEERIRARELRSLATKLKASLRENVKRRLATDVDAIVRAESFSRQVGPRPFADISIFNSLRSALLAQRTVTFTYPKADGSCSKRHVVPYGLLFGFRYYLVGREVEKKEPVLFRLDRMSNVTTTENPGYPPPDFNLDQYSNMSFGVYQELPENITLQFSPEGAADARSYLFHPSQTIEEVDDGSVIVRFRAGGMTEIVWELMAWQATVEILEPERLKRLMRDEVAKLYEHHVKSKGSEK